MYGIPPVTIVSPNVASNALGRAWVLAELLAPSTQVRIAGVERGRAAIWEPAGSSKVPVLSYRWLGQPQHDWRAIRWLREVIGDDVVIVSKPLPHSLGLALAARASGRRMVVDIDDWESGFAQYGASTAESPWLAGWLRLRSYGHRGALNQFVFTRMLEALAARMPHRLVSNRWLEQRFGGRVLYHVRDPEALDPARYLGIPPLLSRDRIWVGFVGTPRPHKGVRVLIEAIAALTDAAAPGLAIMGTHEQGIPEIAFARSVLPPERFRTVPPFALDRLGEHVSAVDIVAVPSLDVPASRGQIPAKVFDALAMAKPVVATAVNDLAEIVDGCGLVVRPGDVGELARAISTLAGDASLRRRLGEEGRRKLTSRYSYAVGKGVILDVVRAAAE